MLSVLIPIYNFNVVKLVNELVDQCRLAGIEFEILCFDDFSRKKYRKENQIIAGTFKVSYLELSENYGRSKIRNTLAKSARYDYLLFLDCDSKINDSKFIQNYLKAIKGNSVINGGRIYKKKKSRSIRKTLHWKYGSCREALSAKERDRRGTASFHTNNFLIPRQMMLENPFDLDISGYGYEDLAFAEKLKSKGINILNINNPTEHLGIEDAEQFLSKTKEAIANLVSLVDSEKIKNVRLHKTYERVKALHLLPILRWINQSLATKIQKNLQGANPKLFLFDFYRLMLYDEYRAKSKL